MALDKSVVKIFMDIFIVLCVIAVWIYVMMGMEPYRRGYFPNDPTLSLPYKEQKITELTLALVGFAVVIATILITEGIIDHHDKGIGEKFFSCFVAPSWAWRSYNVFGVYLFGAVSEQMVVELTKRLIGRLRPNFFAVCQPVPVAMSPLNNLGYIQDFNCAGTNEDKNKEVRLSFYSGHSSYAMYTAVFLICYLQVRFSWRGSHLLRHLVQFALVTAAWYTALTRVVDNMHHWSDVAAGLAVGATFGAIAFAFVLRMKPQKYRSTLPSQWPPMTQTEMPR